MKLPTRMRPTTPVSTALALTTLAALATTACSKPQASTDGDGGGSTATSAAPTGPGLLGGPTLSMLTSGFEGEIDGFSQKAGGAQTPVSLFFKGDKVRFDVPEDMSKGAEHFLGNKAWGIYDTAGKKVTVVSDEKKQAIIVDFNNGKPLGSFGPPGSHGPGGAQSTPSKVTKTGKTETVAGYKCEDWDISSDHKEGTICVAEQGVSWLSLPVSALSGERAWMAELVDGKHFPLRFLSYAKDGATEESRIEVTKIDKKSIDDAKLQVPAGYNVLDLDHMFAGGMPGMPPGMMPPGAFSGMHIPRPH